MKQIVFGRIWRRYHATLIWGGALVLLFLMEPRAGHSTLCIPSLLGLSYCPGCGIGHGIHYALHLQWMQAFDAHVLGIPAAAVLLWQAVKPFFHTPNNKMLL